MNNNKLRKGGGSCVLAGKASNAKQRVCVRKLQFLNINKCVLMWDGWGGSDRANSDHRTRALCGGYSCLMGGRLRVSRALW